MDLWGWRGGCVRQNLRLGDRCQGVYHQWRISNNNGTCLISAKMIFGSSIECSVKLKPPMTWHRRRQLSKYQATSQFATSTNYNKWHFRNYYKLLSVLILPNQSLAFHPSYSRLFILGIRYLTIVCVCVLFHLFCQPRRWLYFELNGRCHCTNWIIIFSRFILISVRKLSIKFLHENGNLTLQRIMNISDSIHFSSFRSISPVWMDVWPVENQLNYGIMCKS